MGLNTNRLKDKNINKSTKKFEKDFMNGSGSTSIRIEKLIRNELSDVQRDIRNREGYNFSLSDTVKYLINFYNKNK